MPLDDEVERLRWVKDEEELENLRTAQAATDQAFEEILESLAVGQTELAVARELERLLRRDGADGLSFDSIVAFGENAAEPHQNRTAACSRKATSSRWTSVPCAPAITPT